MSLIFAFRTDCISISLKLSEKSCAVFDISISSLTKLFLILSKVVPVRASFGNALPKEFSRMLRLEQNGEFEPARKIHHMFTDLFNLLFVDGNPAGVKAMLHEMGMIENVLRLPLVPTRLTTMQKISECLKFRL